MPAEGIKTLEFAPPAAQRVRLPSPLAMRSGGVLEDAVIAYETWGERAPDGGNSILILTGLSSGSHAASHPADPSPGWWEGMVGSGLPIDTGRWHVICMNSLGSCMGSTGPASINPATGEPYRTGFPELAIEDIADAAAAALKALGIERLACIVGGSMGGMSSLAFVARHPGVARSMVNVSGAASAPAFAIALRSLQRELVRSDPKWRGGDYDTSDLPRQGMLMARKLGIISYRSITEWEGRFGRGQIPRREGDPFGMEFEIERYMAQSAMRFVDSYDPNCYLCLSRAMDRFDLEGEGSGALAGIELDSALVLGAESDILFPLESQRRIADGLAQGGAAVEFESVESSHGHDSFLIETERFGKPISAFLAGLDS